MFGGAQIRKELCVDEKGDWWGAYILDFTARHLLNSATEDYEKREIISKKL